MRRLFRLNFPDGVPAGGDPAPNPQADPNSQTGAPAGAPGFDIAAIEAEIRARVMKELEDKKKQEDELAKLDEVARVKKEKEALEAKILEMEALQKKNAYEAELKSLVVAAGASKIDALVKLADTGKSPADAVKELKTNYPELFVKAPTLNELGGGASGTPTTNKTAEDIGKMPMAEYINWRKANK